MIGFNSLFSQIPRLNLSASLALCMMFLIPGSLIAANPDKPDFWVRNDAGTITHNWTDDPDQSLVMNMQGRKVVMQFNSSVTNGLSLYFPFFQCEE